MLIRLQEPPQVVGLVVRRQLFFMADGLPAAVPICLQAANTASSGFPRTSTTNLGFSHLLFIRNLPWVCIQPVLNRSNLNNI